MLVGREGQNGHISQVVPSSQERTATFASIYHTKHAASPGKDSGHRLRYWDMGYRYGRVRVVARTQERADPEFSKYNNSIVHGVDLSYIQPAM